MTTTIHDSLVFACNDGVHICKYFIDSGLWKTNLRIDAECAPVSESCLRILSANDLPLFQTMSSADLEAHYRHTRAQMQTSPAFMVIGKLGFPKSQQSRKHARGLSVFIVVLAVDTATGQSPGVEVAFLLGTTGYPSQTGSLLSDPAADLNLYTAISQNLTSGFTELVGDVRLYLYKPTRGGLPGYHLRFPNSGVSHDRLTTWHSVISTQRRPDDKKKRPRAPVVELPRTTSMALKDKISSEEITLHIGQYRGGKRHAPICALPLYSDVAALLSAKYRARPVRLSEYHLSQETTEYFGQLLGPPAIAQAVTRVRSKAEGLPYSMCVDDVDDIMGAVASAFYEDIGWRMSASPEQVPSTLTYCSVDIDQVSTFDPAGHLCHRSHSLSHRGSQVVLHARKFSFLHPTGTQRYSCDVFLLAMREELLKAEIFCANVESATTPLLGRRTRYNENAFLTSCRFHAGHTYMSKTDRERFIKINPEDLNATAWRVSVRSDCGSVEEDRALVWQCILQVARWWERTAPGKGPQATLATQSLGVVPGLTFVVSGGPVFHVLVALCFAYECHLKQRIVEIAFETYGTKQMCCFPLSNPAQTITDTDVAAVYDKLEANLRWEVPFQLQRIHEFFGRFQNLDLPYAWSAETVLTWGVGCTVGATATGSATEASGTCVLPVVRSIPCPWAPASDSAPPIYFDEKTRVRNGEEYHCYIPLEHDSHTKYPIYGGIFPDALQPSTLIDRPRNPLVQQIQLRQGAALACARISRIQQYNVDARLAIGESGLQKPLSAKLGAIPAVEDAGSHAVSIRLDSCREKVGRFYAAVDNHFKALASSGGYGRVEIAVPHTDQSSVLPTLRSAIHDVLTIVQHHTYTYDPCLWGTLVRFYSLGLRSRIECAILAMGQDSRLSASVEDVRRRDEVNEVVAEVLNGTIKPFYSGRRTLDNPTRTLPRTSYALNRPILCKLRTHLAQRRESILTTQGQDWLTLFYENLGLTRDSMRPIPDFIATHKKYLPSSAATCRACPTCYTIFAEREPDDFLRHVCSNRRPWISLTSPSFQAHHADLVRPLSTAQKLLITLLDDGFSLNIFLAGFGGTGKSTAVRAAAEHLCMKFGLDALALLAFTNVAAMQIRGATISSFVGCTTEELWDEGINQGKWHDIAARFLQNHAERAELLRNTLRYVFVDEVGMITASELDFLQYFLRVVKGKPVPFGGVKVILIGDPLQVPPVALKPGKGFFFQSTTFCSAESRFVVLYLKTVLRTTVERFARWEVAARLGGCYLDALDMDYTKSWGARVSPACTARTTAVRHRILQAIAGGEPRRRQRLEWNLSSGFYLYADRFTYPAAVACADYRADADGSSTPQAPAYVICLEKEEEAYFNAAYAASFPSTAVIKYNAVDVWPAHIRDEWTRRLGAARFQLPQQVVVAVGMRVRFLRNGVAPSVGRNSLGIVVEADPAYIDVRLGSAADSVLRVVATRESIEFQSGSATLMATRDQFPIACCAAGNHYCVQGQTLADVPCLFENSRVNRLSYGAAYTVVSRFQDPAYILPCHALEQQDFVAHPDAVRFDQYHFQQTSVLTEVNYEYRVRALLSSSSSSSSASAAHPAYVVTPMCAQNARACGCLLCCDEEELRTKTQQALAGIEYGQASQEIDVSQLLAGFSTQQDLAADDGFGDDGYHTFGNASPASLSRPSSPPKARSSANGRGSRATQQLIANKQRKSQQGLAVDDGSGDDGYHAFGNASPASLSRPSSLPKARSSASGRGSRVTKQLKAKKQRNAPPILGKRVRRGDGPPVDDSESDNNDRAFDEDYVGESIYGAPFSGGGDDEPSSGDDSADRPEPRVRPVRCIGLLGSSSSPALQLAAYKKSRRVRINDDSVAAWMVAAHRRIAGTYEEGREKLEHQHAEMAVSLLAAFPAEELLPLNTDKHYFHQAFSNQFPAAGWAAITPDSLWQRAIGRGNSGHLNARAVQGTLPVVELGGLQFEALFVCESSRVYVFDDELDSTVPSAYAARITPE
jgi:hypothetical protein